MKELGKRMERLEKRISPAAGPVFWCEEFIHDPEHPQSAEEAERERKARARAASCNDDLVHIVIWELVHPKPRPMMAE